MFAGAIMSASQIDEADWRINLIIAAFPPAAVDDQQTR